MLAGCVHHVGHAERDPVVVVRDRVGKRVAVGALAGPDIATVLERHGIAAEVRPEGHLLVAQYGSFLTS